VARAVGQGPGGRFLENMMTKTIDGELPCP
jgi:hypothetical protein